MEKNTKPLRNTDAEFSQKYLEYTDELKALAIGSQQGNSKKHVELLTKVTPLLWSIVKRNWWGDSFNHEDIIQDILLIIHNKLHTYNPNLPIAPWIRSIANYRILDYVRQHKRKHSLVDSIDDSNVIFEPVDTDDFFLKVENMDFVLQALKSLPHQQALVIYMLKVQGLSIKEVAEKTGSSISAIKLKAHRGYKKIAIYSRKQLG